MNQVYDIVKSTANYFEVRGEAEVFQICRDLCTLGVPRWVVEYLNMLEETHRDAETVNLHTITNCFDVIWEEYVHIRLAAFTVAGQPIKEDEEFDEERKWSKLRDSCMYICCIRTKVDLERMFTFLMHYYGALEWFMLACHEKNFSEYPASIRKYVDDTKFVTHSWQYALLMLEHETVSLRELLSGAFMTRETESILVKLVPSQVFQCANEFNVLTPRNSTRHVDWSSGGYILMNTGNIFFALEGVTIPDKKIVFIGQISKKYFGEMPSIPIFVTCTKTVS
ncbi:Crinkler (CRN) [Phytophthora megakarya]|uniref:Crinkler (CRN) n=1 Tax=Phytophthora megakarya TaxID=4795 RepID=A0A225WL51_9STRA|nr:Crinkler (CRN) [Phytophthora megakarya]